jgi:hypothetical protein
MKRWLSRVLDLRANPLSSTMSSAEKSPGSLRRDATDPAANSVTL